MRQSSTPDRIEKCLRPATARLERRRMAVRVIVSVTGVLSSDRLQALPALAYGEKMLTHPRAKPRLIQLSVPWGGQLWA
jgi:hypothetical protein